MKFRTFCSGIGAPEAAWKPLGWQCLSSSEIDPQASAVLAHHHPEAPNVGDMTTCLERVSDERTDLVVAGTPCQSFSVAGLRKGMDDPRGNMALVYLGLVDKLRPEWVVWENVPGVLSSSGGRDFGAFLGALGQLGYGWAYRVLDAQFVRVESHARAVPQRRRRVFVVGHSGGWRGAAAVLLERESLYGHPAPSRAAWEETAGTPRGGTQKRGWCADTDRATFVADASLCLNAGGMGRQDWETETFVAVAGHCVLASGKSKPNAIGHGSGVRRLTPRECERLQGFPDDYTLVPWTKKKKPMADGPRYRMLGNSMAVNVMSWIGQRIEMANYSGFPNSSNRRIVK